MRHVQLQVLALFCASGLAVTNLFRMRPMPHTRHRTHHMKHRMLPAPLIPLITHTNFGWCARLYTKPPADTPHRFTPRH